MFLFTPCSQQLAQWHPARALIAANSLRKSAMRPASTASLRVASSSFPVMKIARALRSNAATRRSARSRNSSRWMSSSRQVAVRRAAALEQRLAANVRLSMPLWANSRATPFEKARHCHRPRPRLSAVAWSAERQMQYVPEWSQLLIWIEIPSRWTSRSVSGVRIEGQSKIYARAEVLPSSFEGPSAVLSRIGI